MRGATDGGLCYGGGMAKKKQGPHDAAIGALRGMDPAIAAVIDRVGPCGLEPPEADGRTLFAYLARAIAFQQLSTKAATTIHGRFEALFAPELPTPAGLARLSDEQLRGAGLSRQKIASIRAVGEHFAGRDLKIDDLATWNDEEVIADLTRIRGIGRWTVEMLLLFRLGRPDVFAVDDLGIQRGVQRALGLAERPKPKALKELSERWKPHRSVASWYLWRASEFPE